MLTYHETIFPMRPLGGFFTANSLDTRWKGYRVSMGNSMKTGPGVPDWAMARAFLSVGTISLTVRMEAQNLHSGLKRDIWSMSCSAPLPCNTNSLSAVHFKNYWILYCIWQQHSPRLLGLDYVCSVILVNLHIHNIFTVKVKIISPLLQTKLLTSKKMAQSVYSLFGLWSMGLW